MTNRLPVVWASSLAVAFVLGVWWAGCQQPPASEMVAVQRGRSGMVDSQVVRLRADSAVLGDSLTRLARTVAAATRAATERRGVAVQGAARADTAFQAMAGDTIAVDSLSHCVTGLEACMAATAAALAAADSMEQAVESQRSVVRLLEARHAADAQAMDLLERDRNDWRRLAEQRQRVCRVPVLGMRCAVAAVVAAGVVGVVAGRAF